MKCSKKLEKSLALQINRVFSKLFLKIHKMGYPENVEKDVLLMRRYIFIFSLSSSKVTKHRDASLLPGLNEVQKLD